MNCTEWKGINPETDPEYVFYYVANSTVFFVIVTDLQNCEELKNHLDQILSGRFFFENRATLVDLLSEKTITLLN